MNKSLEEDIKEIVTTAVEYYNDELVTDDKVKQIISLFNSSLTQYKKEILEKVIGEDEEGIGINNYHNGINRKQKARNEFRQELRNRLRNLKICLVNQYNENHE